ncbi:MAG: urease accessory protein UreD [Thiothrix sp.]|nr:urease accessory protein UreD [Thiothrix sp.]HPQ96358.1 urease accessory protein UreD [Thiolinea sp.]
MKRVTLEHPVQTGWAAELALDFAQRSGKTVLAGRHQRGPLAVQRPFYPEGEVCHVYVLHPPGGVVGGDRLAINVAVAAGASVLLTTPGATKFYRSGKRLARQQQHFTVYGALEWLPQENIFFPGADSQLATDIHLYGDACYIGWEIHCLGRPVVNERFVQGNALFATRLYRDGRPLFIDRLNVRGEADLQGSAGLRHQPVMATLLATPATTAVLELARSGCEMLLPQGHAGVTLMHEVLIVRYLGTSTAEARRLLRAVWQAIRPLVTGHAAVAPRIWNT